MHNIVPYEYNKYQREMKKNGKMAYHKSELYSVSLHIGQMNCDHNI